MEHEGGFTRYHRKIILFRGHIDHNYKKVPPRRNCSLRSVATAAKGLQTGSRTANDELPVPSH